MMCLHCNKSYSAEEVNKILTNVEVMLEFYPDEENFPQICIFCGKALGVSYKKGVITFTKI